MSTRAAGRIDEATAWAVLAVAIGGFLRLIWMSDIEYKADEAYMFERVVHVVAGREPWPALGMASSQGIRNPGMSIWVFIVLGYIFRVKTPVALARAITLVNVAALGAVLPVGARVSRDDKERDAWRWAALLAATSPVLVVLERKIWAQSILPSFMLALFVAWSFRDRWYGAFAWGLLSAVIGQIHMAGFFFAPALCVWTLFSRAKPFAKLPFALGAVAGVLPALSWIAYMASGPGGHTSHPLHLVYRFEFYQYFFSDLTGLCLSFSLGDDFTDFLRLGSGAVLVVHAVMAAVSVGFVVALVLRAARVVRPAESDPNARNTIFSRVLTLVRGSASETSTLLAATLVGMGGLLTIAILSIYRHYMLVTYPLQYVWLARVALDLPHGRKWLTAFAVGYFVIAIAFRIYIHQSGGAPHGDYGIAFSHQHH